jgi:hypothetical protein
MCEDLIPSSAFGPLGRPRAEELRFWRLIEEREPEADGQGELITLACGHSIVCVIPYPDSQEYAYCSRCVKKLAEADRTVLKCGHE